MVYRQLIGIGLLLACGAVPASAQEPTQEAVQEPAGPRPPGQMRFGRLFLTPSIRLSNLGVDSNVFNTDQDRKADFTGTVAPGADATLDLRRVRLQLTGGADFLYFQKYSTERAINPTVGAGVEVRLRQRSGIFARYGTASIRDRLNFEIDRRVRRRVETGSAGVILGVTRRIKIDATASVERIRFREGEVFRGVALDATLNRDTQSIDTAVRYRLSSLTTVSLTGRFWDDRFPSLPVKDARSNEVRIEGLFQPRALLSGRASVGYTHSSPKRPGAPPFQGVVADVALLYRLLEATQFGVVLERGKGYSYEILYPFYAFQRVEVSVDRHLFGRVGASAEADFHRRKYSPFTLDPSGSGLLPVDIVAPDTGRRYAGRIAVRVARRTQVGFQAEYFGQDRTIAGPGVYNGLRVGLTAAYGVFSVGGRVAPDR